MWTELTLRRIVSSVSPGYHPYLFPAPPFPLSGEFPPLPSLFLAEQAQPEHAVAFDILGRRRHRFARFVFRLLELILAEKAPSEHDARLGILGRGDRRIPGDGFGFPILSAESSFRTWSIFSAFSCPSSGIERIRVTWRPQSAWQSFVSLPSMTTYSLQAGAMSAIFNFELGARPARSASWSRTGSPAAICCWMECSYPAKTEFCRRQ